MSIIAIDMGGTRVKTGLVNNGKIEHFATASIDSSIGMHAYLPLIAERIATIKANAGAGILEGVAMSFPGIVDTVANKVICAGGKYEDASGLALAEWVGQQAGLPFKIENDARCACLGEWKYGAGKGCSNMVMSTLGTGVGSGAIVDGHLLTGKHFQAGILGGHSIIDYMEKDSKCSCGKYGCVESLASTWKVKRMATEHPLYKNSSLRKAETIDMKTIFELAGSDELAGLLQKHCLEAWGAGLVNLVHAYDPEVVVVGGGIMHSKDVIVPYFIKLIQERAWCPSGFPEIKSAIYPDTAGLLGAALLFEKEKL